MSHPRNAARPSAKGRRAQPAITTRESVLPSEATRQPADYHAYEARWAYALMIGAGLSRCTQVSEAAGILGIEPHKMTAALAAAGLTPRRERPGRGAMLSRADVLSLLAPSEQEGAP